MSVGLDRMISGLSFQHLRTYVGMNSTTRPQMNMPPHPSHQTFRASPASYECVYANNNCPRLPPLMLRHLSSIIMSHARQRTAHCPFKLGPKATNRIRLTEHNKTIIRQEFRQCRSTRSIYPGRGTNTHGYTSASSRPLPAEVCVHGSKP